MKYALFCSALLFAACGSRYEFQAEHTFPGAVWAWQDTLDFKFNIADTAARYDLILAFTHQADFANQNLYVRLKTHFPDGHHTTDVQSFDLFDTQGASLGDCSGKACTVTLDLQKSVHFRQPGDYTLTLEQWMRRDSVPGIQKVEMLVKKVEGGR